MKVFIYLFIFSAVLSCHEKSYTDGINFEYPQKPNLKIQAFNEDNDDADSFSNLLYKGPYETKIKVKYFLSPFPPEPIPFKTGESGAEHDLRFAKYLDSLKSTDNPFFNYKELEIKNDFQFSMIDSLNNKNISIFVKQNDTIPLYKKTYGSDSIKAYKAFPVFIKNISSKTINFPLTTNLLLTFLESKKWWYIRNNNQRICGTGWDKKPYIELKPNEILIYTIPFFKKGTKKKFKIVFYNIQSKEFELSIDKNIVDQQNMMIPVE